MNKRGKEGGKGCKNFVNTPLTPSHPIDFRPYPNYYERRVVSTEIWEPADQGAWIVMIEDRNDGSKAPKVLHYFVDEAGDPVLFDRKGRVLVGTEGCSKYFIVGKLDVPDPEGLGVELESLRKALLADPYFKRVPSMQPERRKTSVMFHAHNDVPEVRREVFRLIQRQDLKFYAVVRDKSVLSHTEKLRREKDRTYRYNQNDQYDNLISDLFRHFHGHADITSICFATRGRKNRNAALQIALERAKSEIERGLGFSPGHFEIDSAASCHSAGLQTVDYYLWAIQRHFERRESRYLEYLWPQVKLVHCLDELVDGRLGVLYGPNLPLMTPGDEQA